MKIFLNLIKVVDIIYKALGVLKILSRSNNIKFDSYKDYSGGRKQDLKYKENVLR